MCDLKEQNLYYFIISMAQKPEHDLVGCFLVKIVCKVWQAVDQGYSHIKSAKEESLPNQPHGS